MVQLHNFFPANPWIFCSCLSLLSSAPNDALQILHFAILILSWTFLTWRNMFGLFEKNNLIRLLEILKWDFKVNWAIRGRLFSDLFWFLPYVKVRFSQKVVICLSYRQTDEPFFVPQFQIWNLPHSFVKETMLKSVVTVELIIQTYLGPTI